MTLGSPQVPMEKDSESNLSTGHLARHPAKHELPQRETLASSSVPPSFESRELAMRRSAKPQVVQTTDDPIGIPA